MTVADLEEIQKELRDRSSLKARQAFHKFVPGSQNVYGVRLPLINEMARRHKEGGFPLVESLWKAGAFEERLLAAKILALVSKKDPARALSLVSKFSKEVSDWAVCDTLGQQSIRPIAKLKEKQILGLSGRWVKSPRAWQRRLSLVLLEGYSREARLHPIIRARLKKLEGDRDPYVRKAVEWTKRNLKKYGPAAR